MLYVYYRFALFIPKFILKNRKIAKQKFKTKKKEKKNEKSNIVFTYVSPSFRGLLSSAHTFSSFLSPNLCCLNTFVYFPTNSFVLKENVCVSVI